MLTRSQFAKSLCGEVRRLASGEDIDKLTGRLLVDIWRIHREDEDLKSAVTRLRKAWDTDRISVWGVSKVIQEIQSCEAEKQMRDLEILVDPLLNAKFIRDMASLLVPPKR